jgi:4-hydroxybenzoate polyprenyltransferase
MRGSGVDVEADKAQAAPRFRLARGILLEVRPLPMAAALLVALLGALWAGARGAPPPPALPWVLAAVFFGLITAHLMDSYVDVVKRGDRTPGDLPLLFRDSTGVLRDPEYGVGIVAAGAASASCIVPVALFAGPLPATLLGAALALSLVYAPLLDKTMAGVSFGYPLGACAVLLAAFLSAGGSVDLPLLWLAGGLFTSLVGIKLRADVIDIAGDRAIGKRTVAAALGERAATRGGYALAAGGLIALAFVPLAFPVTLLFALPPLAASAAFGVTGRLDPVKASLWMSHAMLGALAAEVAVLALA